MESIHPSTAPYTWETDGRRRGLFYRLSQRSLVVKPGPDPGFLSVLIPCFPIIINQYIYSGCLLYAALCQVSVENQAYYIVLGQERHGHREVTCYWLREVLRAH